MCVCGHRRRDHNNRSKGASFEYRFVYNTCLASSSHSVFCPCGIFTSKKKREKEVKEWKKDETIRINPKEETS